MAPSSLQRQCTNAAIRNLNRIDEDGLGVTPWRLLKPILNKCENPKMLREWEKNTPQIRGETGDIWLKFIKRDVPNWRSKPHEPSNPESWWKVYKKLKDEADREESRAEQMLMDKMSKIKKDEAEWKVAPPTTAIPERKGRNKGVAMQFQRGSDNNGLRFTTGTKTKDFMQSVRRQAAESKLQRSGVLARPTKSLNEGAVTKKIFSAPQHMVEDRQRQAELARHTGQRVPDAAKQESKFPRPSLASRAAHDLKVREERLKAIRQGNVVTAPSSARGSTSASATGVAASTPASTPPKKVERNSKKTSPSLIQMTSTAKSKLLGPSSIYQSTAEKVAASQKSNTIIDDTNGEFDNTTSTSSHDKSIQSSGTARSTAQFGSKAQPLNLKRPPAPSKATMPTVLRESKKSPSKEHSQTKPIRESASSVVPPSKPLVQSGAKRKAPTILLPMKRVRR